jgi:hypothetical protein
MMIPNPKRYSVHSYISFFFIPSPARALRMKNAKDEIRYMLNHEAVSSSSKLEMYGARRVREILITRTSSKSRNAVSKDPPISATVAERVFGDAV